MVETKSIHGSSSDFRESFSQIMLPTPKGVNHHLLKAAWLDTKLGALIVIADEKNLYLLEFANRQGLEKKILRLGKKLKASIIPGNTTVIDQIKREIEKYFDGHCMVFETPLHLIGSLFQKKVWHALMNIKASETRSYADIAKLINQPKAYRAVALANAANQLAIIIPCHRVINSNGALGGYAGGVPRKQWLLAHEKNYSHPYENHSLFS